jgi:hypothetical protein
MLYTVDQLKQTATPSPMPPKTEKELRQMAEISRRLDELARDVQQNNLNNAVLLAQQAARGHGDLIEHFAELSRRFGSTLSKPKRGRLRMIEGDKV